MNNINGNKHRRTKMSLFIKLSKELKVAKISFISGLLPIDSQQFKMLIKF